MADEPAQKAPRQGRRAPDDGVDNVTGHTQPFGPSSSPPGKLSKQALVASLGAEDDIQLERSHDGSMLVRSGDKVMPIRVVRDTYVGQVVGGKFTIVEFIDRGGMGEVYLGMNEAIGQKVAVKFLNKKLASDESIVRRFVNEARAYCKVTHPNAVTLLEYGQHDDGALYIITEFIEGKSLSKLMRKQGPLSPVEAIEIAVQCCGVLSAAHHQGVIHRDLKPDNIMIMAGPRGRAIAKVLDFGIAKDMSEDGAHMTETGAIFGTPEFMSPEQARGEVAGPRSDLYAMGIILFYMVTGRLPFRGKNKFAVLNQQISKPPPRFDEVAPQLELPRALERVIHACMSKEPSDRFVSADALIESLEELHAALLDGGSLDDRPMRTLLFGPGADASEAEEEPSDADPHAITMDAPPEGFSSSRDLLGEPEGSEASDDGASAPALATGDERPLHERTLDLVRERPRQLGDSLDLRRERPDEPAWADDEWDEEPVGTFKRPLYQRAVPFLMLGVAIAGVAWFVHREMNKTLLPPDANPAQTNPAQTDPRPDQTTGTPARDPEAARRAEAAVALLPAVEKHLATGALADAAATIERSREAAADADLDPQQLAQRKSLSKKVTVLLALERDARAALEDRKCQDVLSRVNEMKVISTGLADQWRDRAARCEARARRRTTPRRVVKTAPKTTPKTTPKNVTADPVTPEPVTPDPVTPKALTPEPVTPKALTPDPVTPKATTPDPGLPPKSLDGLPPRKIN